MALKDFFNRLMNTASNIKSNPVGALMMNTLPMSGNTINGLTAFYRDGYQSNAVVYRSIQQIINAMAPIEIEAVRHTKQGDVEVLDNHESLKLLARPNPNQTWDDFLQNLVVDWLCTGEFFIVKYQANSKKLPQELWLLPPRNMEVIGGRSGVPAAYVYQSAGGMKMRFEADPVTGESAVKMVKDYNPFNQLRGQSPLQAAGLGIDIHNSGMIWNKSLLKNGARPSGALVVKGILNPEEYSQLSADLDKTFAGADNSGRPLILEGGADWKELSTNAKDMEFIQSMRDMGQTVAAALGVPFALVNPDSATYNNMGNANLMFYEQTVIPRLMRILEALSDFMERELGGITFRIDEDSISALEPRRREKVDRMNSLIGSGVLTIDEVRTSLGFTPRGGSADMLLVPTGKTPLDALGDPSVAIPNVSDPMNADAEDEGLIKALMKSGCSLEEARRIAQEEFNISVGEKSKFIPADGDIVAGDLVKVKRAKDGVVIGRVIFASGDTLTVRQLVLEGKAWVSSTESFKANTKSCQKVIEAK